LKDVLNDYPNSVKARLKNNPVSKDKIKRLSSQWRQDKKIIRLVKARWKDCPASEDKMKRLSGQWRQDKKVVPPVKTRLIISNSLFVMLTR